MVKEKPNSTRIYDKDGFRQRAACLCVRSIDEDEVSYVKIAIERILLKYHIILRCY